MISDTSICSEEERTCCTKLPTSPALEVDATKLYIPGDTETTSDTEKPYLKPVSTSTCSYS